jgi:hypothetical protein
MTTQAKQQLKNGLLAETFPEGIYISGNTFHNRDLLKSLGALWAPDVKKWRLPTGTDLSPLLPPPPPPRPAINLWAVRRVGGRCCSRAMARFDSENPQGPLWYVCPDHGTWKSDYTGD